MSTDFVFLFRGLMTLVTDDIQHVLSVFNLNTATVLYNTSC